MPAALVTSTNATRADGGGPGAWLASATGSSPHVSGETARDRPAAHAPAPPLPIFASSALRSAGGKGVPSFSA